MDYTNNAGFQQTCERLQRAGIAKVNFQSYWFSDEEQIDEIYCFDENEQEVEPPSPAFLKDLQRELWDYMEQEEDYPERFGRFEIYTLYKRLVRLGATYLGLVGADYMKLVAPYMDLPEVTEYVWCDHYFYGGQDDEAVERAYTLLQKDAIHTLTLQVYYGDIGYEIKAISCVDGHGQEVALPKVLSEGDLHVTFFESLCEEEETRGLFKLLVNERRSVFLSELEPRNVGLAEEAEDFFGGGWPADKEEEEEA
jgi:hypothetical protein